MILAIETSCDETAAALLAEGRYAVAQKVASQIPWHRPHGGVVPELAARRHMETLAPLVEEVLQEAAITWGEVEAVAVTRGPGLVGSLLVGVQLAKGLALSLDRPLLGVNHLAGHLLATHLAYREKGSWVEPPLPRYPAVGLIVSGSHTDLVRIDEEEGGGPGRLTLLGSTRDDAAGEAFDKAARILGLSYPGGPAIQEAAGRIEPGEPLPAFPRPLLGKGFDFSFSGLKTALLYWWEEEGRRLGERALYRAAAGFQEAVVEVLYEKTAAAMGPPPPTLSWWRWWPTAGCGKGA
ncbi:MAG: tRNA (adenosine(37)-N6)-threonylcarbamoyltransferase complex transferase subunit TsaD [Bacillota bacterium]|nr:tRNA (adenosine(37)-N6)-threonylcarbamoyltransferase complex transferase subunit TsaD [Bacillota bacterium]